MRKEWIITLFLIVNKIFFNTFKLSKKTNNIVFLCDFGDNAEYVTKELGRRGYRDVVVLKTGKCKTSFKDAGVREIVSFKPTKPFDYLRGLKRLATARTVLIDNYAALLSVCHFNDEVEVIQLWHAAGAVKKFGMVDPSLTYRTPKAINRISKVYEEMDKIVVGSPFMAQIFARAFQKESNAFLHTGIPRTDFFFDEKAMSETTDKVYATYPELRSKKVVLYAPTFRDNELTQQQIPLDFVKIASQLGDDYRLVIKLHPAVAHDLNAFRHPYIINVANKLSVNDLLLVTDYLVSDYSSIPYEFALLGKPQIFYPYDLEQYQMSRGFWDSYDQVVPGPVVDSDDELVHTILHMDFDLPQVEQFAAKWNCYSDGHTARKLVDYLLNEE